MLLSHSWFSNWQNNARQQEVIPGFCPTSTSSTSKAADFTSFSGPSSWFPTPSPPEPSLSYHFFTELLQNLQFCFSVSICGSPSTWRHSQAASDLCQMQNWSCHWLKCLLLPSRQKPHSQVLSDLVCICLSSLPVCSLCSSHNPIPCTSAQSLPLPGRFPCPYRQSIHRVIS